VDISENGYGVSLLNDCKYGFSAEGSTLSLTALKSGIFPDPNADIGCHEFTYSLMPHTGSLYDADVIKESYILNNPPVACEVNEQDGTLAESMSLVSCDKQNVIIEAVKRAEKDNSLIVRMYEAFGKREKVTVAAPFKKCTLCDLMENEIMELEMKNGKVTLPIKNFEIITLKFE
jgi:alpha-mannosidase